MPLSNKGPGPIECRTATEARFIERHWPCESCGEPLARPAARISIKETRESAGAGRERLTRAGFCPSCATKLERVYEYPTDAKAPRDELGGPSPSQALSAAELEKLGREALGAPKMPKTLSPADFWRWREIVVGGIATFAELGKHRNATSAAKSRDAILALLARYDADLARRKVELEETRKKIHAFDNDALAAHREWLASGGKRGVRLVLEGAVIENMGIRGDFHLSKARLTDCAIILQVLDYSEWIETEMVRVRGFYTRIGMSKLNGASLEDCSFKGAAFMVANLDGATISGGEMNEASFIRSDLNKARFDSVSLAKARFGDSVLDGAVFTGCDLRGADFGSANPTFAARGTSRGTVFKNCDLRGAAFAGRSLAGATFEGCKLAKVTGPASDASVTARGCDLDTAALTARLS